MITGLTIVCSEITWDWPYVMRVDGILAEMFNCSKTTVQKILAKQRDYETAFEENVSGSQNV